MSKSPYKWKQLPDETWECEVDGFLLKVTPNKNSDTATVQVSSSKGYSEGSWSPTVQGAKIIAGNIHKKYAMRELNAGLGSVPHRSES